jgi:hypothetical protein
MKQYQQMIMSVSDFSLLRFFNKDIKDISMLIVFSHFS